MTLMNGRSAVPQTLVIAADAASSITGAATHVPKAATACVKQLIARSRIHLRRHKDLSKRIVFRSVGREPCLPPLSNQNKRGPVKRRAVFLA